jgi:hypothetical protein
MAGPCPRPFPAEAHCAPNRIDECFIRPVYGRRVGKGRPGEVAQGRISTRYGNSPVNPDSPRIPLQITHRYRGILTHTVEGTAFWIKQLLDSPDYARRLGETGREHVRTNFLLTRHLREYLLLFLFLEHWRERVIYLG